LICLDLDKKSSFSFRHYLRFTPDCFSILLRVPAGISFLGCGTVVVPGFPGWRKCR
jgi:hypothetical protein